MRIVKIEISNFVSKINFYDNSSFGQKIAFVIKVDLVLHDLHNTKYLN